MSSKTTPFAAYLVRKGTKLVDALSEKARPLPRHPKSGTPCVVVKHAKPREPWWWDVVSGLASGISAPELALPGAVMFLETTGRLFALTFGHGYSMLNPGALEPDFGLRAVLQAVDAAGLRSVDVRSMESSPLLSRRQRHDGQAIHAFGIDRLHDLLKGITGRLQKHPASSLAGTILTGADGVHATAGGADIAALTASVGELFSLASKGYPAEFNWVAHLRLVRAEADVRACWAKLLKSPGSIATFGPPVPLEGHQLGSLRVSWNASALPAEATAAQAIARVQQLKGLAAEKAIAKLRNDRLQLVDGDGEVVTSWRAYDCLGAEIRVKGKDHVLTAGDWYRLDARYKEEVEAEFGRLLAESKTYPQQLTPWLAGDAEEKDYNARVGPAAGWKVLDRKTYRYGRSQVELCDLLDPSAGLLVHVKRGRHSATLSHLFSQGIVSALTILQDTGARDHLSSAVSLSGPQKAALTTAIEDRRARVVYAIADHKPKADWKLPFFAMLAATQAATRLREHRLAVDVVRVHDSVPKKAQSAGKAKKTMAKKKK